MKIRKDFHRSGESWEIQLNALSGPRLNLQGEKGY